MGLWQRCHLVKCPARGTYSISNVSIIRRKTRSLPLHCSESSGIYVNRIKRGTDMCRACTLCHFPHVVLYKYCLTESHNDLQQRAQRGCSLYAWLASRPQGNCTSLCLWHLSWATLLILANRVREKIVPATARLEHLIASARP